MLLATAAQAEPVQNPGPHTVRKAQPACMSVADWDRIMLYAKDTKNPLEQARAPRAFQELSDASHPQVGGGRVCTMIPKPASGGAAVRSC